MFSKTRTVCSAMVPRSIFAVEGSKGVIPETKTNRPSATTPREYGPMAFGPSGTLVMSDFMFQASKASGPFDSRRRFRAAGFRALAGGTGGGLAGPGC